MDLVARKAHWKMRYLTSPSHNVITEGTYTHEQLNESPITFER